MAAAAATPTAPTTPPRGFDLAADEVPVWSPAGSQAGAEQFDVGTPAPTVDEQDKDVKELKKKVTQLEAMIQEFLQGHDPWHQRKEVYKPGGGEAATPGKELSNKDG